MSNKEELKKEALEKVAGGGKPNVNYDYKVGDKITVRKNGVAYSCTITQRGVTLCYGYFPVYKVSCPSEKSIEQKWYLEFAFFYEDGLDSCQYPE